MCASLSLSLSALLCENLREAQYRKHFAEEEIFLFFVWAEHSGFLGVVVGRKTIVFIAPYMRERGSILVIITKGAIIIIMEQFELKHVSKKVSKCITLQHYCIIIPLLAKTIVHQQLSSLVLTWFLHSNKNLSKVFRTKVFPGQCEIVSISLNTWDGRSPLYCHINFDIRAEVKIRWFSKVSSSFTFIMLCVYVCGVLIPSN